MTLIYPKMKLSERLLCALWLVICEVVAKDLPGLGKESR